jgi:hypothetical protein
VNADKVWHCMCGDDHFLRVLFYDDDPEGYVSLVDGTHCASFWCRVKSAWKLLRTGSAPHYGVEVCLDPETTAEFAQAIADAAKKTGTPER